jgi:hypothetical protein
MLDTGFLLCLYAGLFLLTLFATYWIIRLAVRHGIADADERRRTRVVLEQYELRQKQRNGIEHG